MSDYQITQQLYESCNSVVYRGYRLSDQRPVILKMLKNSYSSLERVAWFKREYEVTRDLQLAGVVDVYELITLDEQPVIVLEDFGGDSLAVLGVAGQLDLGEFLKLAIAISAILAEIHAAKIIHKDINPSNIVLNPTNGVVKIIDFGICSVLSQENPTWSNLNLLEGTLAYISPEQTGRMNRAIDYRSDFYSLGVTFYELLKGKLPFISDDTFELVHSHIAKQPISLTDEVEIPTDVSDIVRRLITKNTEKLPQSGQQNKIPKAVSDIVIKLMAKKAEDRYQSGQGLKLDLEKCLHQLESKGQIEPFTLGQQDISEQLQIPQKLYGREGEVAALLAAFERVSQRKKEDNLNLNLSSSLEIVLVTGYSGVGKSALVREVHKSITAKQGNFITGKFDQHQLNIPYYAIAQAFNELCCQLLAEKPLVLNQWRDKILSALGSNGQVLIEVIPNLELVIGQQPPVAEVGAQEAQNRFNLVFQNFIKALCQPEQALVLFIDDLQWSDHASLNLLKTIISDKEISNLLIICAYRDNEVDAVHPLIMTIEELKKEPEIVSFIHLDKLKCLDVHNLVADSLACSLEDSQTLANLVYTKTQGNAFFSIEFLKSLYAEGLLKFEYSFSRRERGKSEGKWQWDVAQIQAKEITDNVVNLMARKIGKLGNSSRNILHLAACIGNRFNLLTLAIIAQDKTTEVLAHLFPALQEGLVISLNEKYKLLQVEDDIQASEVKFKFLHDRVQQAAYSLINKRQRQQTHLRIARLLLQNTTLEALPEEIFEIVDHFNLSLGLVSHQQEKYKIAELNLMAGQKAKTATAYGNAVRYLTTGRKILPKDSWQTHYDLTLKLYSIALEAEYLNTNFKAVDTLSKIVENKTQNLLDITGVCQTKIQAYIAQNRQEAAINTGLQFLEKLGFSISQSPPQYSIIEELYKLPEMLETDKLAAMQILMNISAPAFIARPDLLPRIVWTMVNLCIENGNSQLSPFAYAFYGLLLCGGGEIESGYRFGKLALRLLNKFDTRAIKTKVLNLFNGLILHWKEPASKAIKYLKETVEIGLANGDVEFACYAAIHYCSNFLLTGNSLEIVQQEQKKYIDLIQRVQQYFPLYHAQIWRQLALNLSGKVANVNYLRDEFFDEFAMLPALQKTNNLMSLYAIYLVKGIINYLFKNYQEALENTALAAEYEHGATGSFTVAQNSFYYSLALLAQYHQVNQDEQVAYWQKVAVNQQKLKNWANHAPMNFQHKYDLVEAEKARALGQNWQAAELYERAIKGAKAHKYLQEEALAYELAAEFYLACDMEEIAQTYLSKAHFNYQRWQAWAKVEDLEARYPQFLTQWSSARDITTYQPTTLLTNPPTNSTVLDLTSIIKGSQALSSEIVLDTLLTKMMKIVLENAGAEKGYLILPDYQLESGNKKEQWVVKVSGTIESNQVQVLQSIPIETVSGSSKNPLVSNAIVNYVVRTQESVVLNDAVNEGNFTRATYVIRQQPKSVLCTPLLNQGKLVGILYLENNLTTGAFSIERLEVLSLLSSQAAISIQNAKLYKEVHESENQLRQFLEVTPVGVAIHDPTGRVSYINQTGQCLLGQDSQPECRKEELASVYQLYVAGTDQLYPTEQLPALRALKGENVTISDIEIHQNGKIIPCEVSSIPIKNEQGNILYAISTFQDITERQQAEKVLADYNRTLEAQITERTEALRQSESQLNTIITNTSDGLLILDSNGEICFANPAATELLNKPLEDLINFEWGIPTVETTEIPIVSPSGESQTLEMKATTSQWQGIPAYIVSLRDISVRKQAELALAKAKEAAEAANQAKSTFLANMSHELRSPLNAILGFAQLMSHSQILSSDDKVNLDIIIRSGEHLLALINQVLDLSKIEAGRTNLHLTKFNLYHLLDDLKNMFQIQAEGKGLQLIFECSAHVPQYIQTDEVKLRQVLINFLSNALKFTEKGFVSLRVCCEEMGRWEDGVAGEQGSRGRRGDGETGRRGEMRATIDNSQFSILNSPSSPPHQRLTFEVEDTGAGIAAEEIDKLFQAFVQTQTGRESTEGTGLGLAISYQFVQLMGGEITVNSQVGQGSQFKFDLQVSTVDARDVANKQLSRRVIALEPNQPSYRILVVDDKWDNRQLLIKIVKPLGFELCEACNGQKAVEISQHWKPHLIFMDMRMPVLNGYEASQQIKSTIKGQATAIIAVTAHSFEEDRSMVLDAGCDDFIRKPFQETDIFEVMQKQLGLRYIYEETVGETDSSKMEPLVLKSEDLVTLPDDWLACLHQATLEGDLEKMLVLIAQIQEDNQSIAQPLIDLARSF
ncbi:MAG: AAA family ATPase, partial [Coleofasciculaceae cyanobacterium]